jgi:hypothetical protein
MAPFPAMRFIRPEHQAGIQTRENSNIKSDMSTVVAMIISVFVFTPVRCRLDCGSAAIYNNFTDGTMVMIVA